MPRVCDVLTTCEEYSDLCKRILRDFSPSRVKHWGFRNWEAIEWSRITLDQSTPLLIISNLKDFPARRSAQQPQLGQRRRRHLVFTREMPSEALPTRMARLNIRDDRRLHIAALKDRKTIEAIIRRAICGLASPEDDRIVDAWWEGDAFVVLSPSFQRLSIPLARLSRLIGADSDSISKYEIDSDGSFVYWPHADIHLGWLQFLRMVDPAAVLAARIKHEKFNRRYGSAIRSVRKTQGLRQSDISGLTPRQVGRIEKGECRATLNSLTKLAKAHDLKLNDYLFQLAEKLG